MSATPAAGFMERHFTVGEVAALWNISDDSARRMFEREPGVLIIEGRQGIGRGRRYRTLRIPESVAARVYRRQLNPPGVKSAPRR